MNASIVKFAVNAIADRIGLSVSGLLKSDADGEVIELAPTDGHPNDLFVVCFRLGWRSVESNFQPGLFSAPMIARMGKCGLGDRSMFVAFASAQISKKIKVVMRVNGADINPIMPETWPVDWSRLEMGLKLLPVDVDPENTVAIERWVLDMVVPFFGMIAALIGVEEQERPGEGDVEGQAKQALVTYYERKKVNREACIQLHGALCVVCGFDFAEHYGALGVGYIEVHHLKPLSEIRKSHCINVQTDLLPLCSNCHSMVHREDPPVSIDRLRDIVIQELKNK